MPTLLADEDALTRAIIAMAFEYGCYGYRRVTVLLQADGWQVGKDRVQRIWRRRGLKVPSRHRPRGKPVVLYTFRQVAAARMKLMFEPAAVAAMLGHGSDECQWALNTP